MDEPAAHPRPPDADATRPYAPPGPGADPVPSWAVGETSGEVEPPPPSAPADPASPVVLPPPDDIPGYRLMGQIGRGGMGTVYLAQRLDDRFRGRVAIKVMRRGLDTEEMLERFHLERQVLGALNHPNIARLYDAGATPDGRPYFVMEYAEGLPVDAYCDERNLTVQDRIRLFTKVCAAVHYAHQNLIVHRDLKPSNILVTHAGEPKLLDFGIAKLLNPELLGLPALTRADQRIMTYEYASPEQVQGQAITTASDVYALGVILYELLSGHRPYQIERRHHAEAVRVICESEPERPSTAVSRASTRHTAHGEMHTITAGEIARRREAQLARLRRSLAGDLDNIVLKALRKSAHRRYSTAQALADDLDRHLAGQTVTARAPTFAYRTGKFIRRHRGGVATAALIALGLIASTALVARAWHRAETALAAESVAREDARLAADAEREARLLAEFRYDQLRRMFTIEDELYQRIDRLPGATAAREVLSTVLLDAMESLARDFPDDERLRLELAIQYRRVGRLAAAGENSVRRGVLALRRSLALLDNLRDAEPEHLRTALELARALRQLGDRDEAHRLALDTAERAHALAGDPAAPDDLPILHAEALMQAALVRMFQSRYPEAEAHLAEALEIAVRTADARPDNPAALAALAYAHEQFGFLYDFTGREEEELAAHRRCLDLRKRVAELAPSDDDARRRLVMAHERVGRALMDLDRFDEAEAEYRVMQNLARAGIEDDPFSGRAFSDLARSFENAADLALRRNQPEAAEAYARAFLAHAREAVDRDPTDLAKRRMLALASYKLGRALVARDLRAESIDAFRAATDEFTAALDVDPADMQIRKNLMLASYHLGVNARASADLPGAAAAFERVLREGAEVDARGELNAQDRTVILRAANALCAIAHDEGRGDRVVAIADEGMTILAERPFLLVRQKIRGLLLLARVHDALDLVHEAMRPYDARPTPNSAERAEREELARLEAECLARLQTLPGFDDPPP